MRQPVPPTHTDAPRVSDAPSRLAAHTRFDSACPPVNALAPAMRRYPPTVVGGGIGRVCALDGFGSAVHLACPHTVSCAAARPSVGAFGGTEAARRRYAPTTDGTGRRVLAPDDLGNMSRIGCAPSAGGTGAWSSVSASRGGVGRGVSAGQGGMPARVSTERDRPYGRIVAGRVCRAD